MLARSVGGKEGMTPSGTTTAPAPSGTLSAGVRDPFIRDFIQLTSSITLLRRSNTKPKPLGCHGEIEKEAFFGLYQVGAPVLGLVGQKGDDYVE